MIVILTGAGISQESGLAVFRAADGLWASERVEDVATPGGFTRDPQKVYGFYNARRRELTGGSVHPNAAHRALAKLEAEYTGRVLVITQNIDNLHERAGTKNLLHMHGELLKARCMSCGSVQEHKEDLTGQSPCRRCGKTALRPHIVWFEEMPLYLDDIEEALGRCRIFAAIGTSGNVYPAAGFALAARQNGAETTELNLEPSRTASNFHKAEYGPATEVVPAWVEKILTA